MFEAGSAVTCGICGKETTVTFVGDREGGKSYDLECRHRNAMCPNCNVLVRDDTRAWQTATAGVDPSLFAWDIHGEAVPVPGARPSSRLMLEAPNHPDLLVALEDILYGTDTTDPRMPSPSELVDLYEAYTRLTVTYNGDGSYTVSGPDNMVTLLEDGRFQIDAPSVFFLKEDVFVVRSY